jgi:UDP-glucuronate decarboxylase
MDMNDGRVVSNFIVQALKGEDVTIYGEGLQTRSFCYVDDLIDGLILMMNNQVGFVGPVNLGNPSEFTIKDFANMVINKTSSSSKLVNKELPSDDPCRRRPDINLAKDKLGWEPKIRIEEGLDKTIQYFSKKIKETV